MKAKTLRPCFRLVYATCLVLIFGLLESPLAHAHTFGGRAFAAFVNAPTLGAGPLFLADTGELSPLGGWEAADRLGAQVPRALSSEVLNSATVGHSDTTSSSCSLANVTVLPGHVAQLKAQFVRAQALATTTGTEGSTEIHDLTLAGVPVQVTGAPNQTVEIPGAPILGLLGQVIGMAPSPGTLIINEQAVTSDGVSQAITVNALHLILATGEEVILGSARSHVNPDGQPSVAEGQGRANPARRKVAVATREVPPAGKVMLASATIGLTAPVLPAVRPSVIRRDYCPANTKSMVRNLPRRLSARSPIVLAELQPQEGEHECFDFVTGGGFFFGSTDGPGRVNFGFNAGYKNGTQVPLMAHLNLVDHNSGRHVKIESATSYGPSFFFELGNPCRCRSFSGDGTSDGTPVTYTVEVCDEGEPGNSPNGTDRFRIELSDGYTAIGNPIVGGNIQLHKPCLQCE